MENLYSMQFPNIGFIGCDLADDDMEPILAEIVELSKDFTNAIPARQGLVGQIKHEYVLVKSYDHIEKLAKKMLDEYCHTFSYNGGHSSNYKLNPPWVNFQRKHEYNPMHNHSGTFSFVIWIKIPYTMEQEKLATNYVLEDKNNAGTFNFHYTDALGLLSSWSIPADKTYERRMIMFPANLNHSVNPFFSSDEFRISVSGNLSRINDTVALSIERPSLK